MHLCRWDLHTVLTKQVKAPKGGQGGGAKAAAVPLLEPLLLPLRQVVRSDPPGQQPYEQQLLDARQANVAAVACSLPPGSRVDVLLTPELVWSVKGGVGVKLVLLHVSCR